MKKKTRIKLLLPLLVLCLAAMGSCPHSAMNPGARNNRSTAAPEQHEAKIYCNATINDDFDASTVLVVMDKYTGGMNKRHEEGFFGNFEKLYVKDLTVIEGSIKNALIAEDRFRQILEIKLPFESKENVLSVIHELEQAEGILYAGPNCYYYPCNEPNDEYYNNPNAVRTQWGLHGTYGIGAPAAWDFTVGSHDIKVGIVDTGIASHPDLNANLTSGWNFVDDNNNTDDTKDHGTQMAGICGSAGNNTIGTTGVCWNVTLVPLKISNDGNVDLSPANTTTKNVIAAITYAEQNNIGILNFSWGHNVFNDIALKNAIDSFWGLFICSAGNSSGDIDITPYYPPSFLLDNMITVGAIDNYGFISSGSGYSATAVHIFAPGYEILSTYPITKCLDGTHAGYKPPDNSLEIATGYHTGIGTSHATAFTSGAAALVKSYFPNISPYELKQLIMKNAVKDIPDLWDKCVSGGRLSIASIFDLYGGGSGTELDPFQIQTAQHLKNLHYTLYTDRNRYYEICNNINVAPTGSWIPLNAFNGTLEGGGYTVSGVSIYPGYTGGSEPMYDYGFFKSNDGIIKNLTIEANIYVPPPASGMSIDNIGVFAGVNNGIIEDCTSATNASSMPFMISCNNANTFVGGITGYNSYGYGQISGCVNYGTIYHPGTMGGIAGNSWGDIDNCYNGGTLQYTALGNHGIGGINGLSCAGMVSNSENAGVIEYIGPYSSVLVKPCMGQITGSAGMRYGASFSGNAWTGGAVIPGNMQIINGYNQAQYVSQGEYGSYQ